MEGVLRANAVRCYKTLPAFYIILKFFIAHIPMRYLKAVANDVKNFILKFFVVQ
ncbi:hypothetical protein KCQ_07653 [Pectobacterium atrosepticum ICMP 1526]|nr:hypothetical protein KCQ_07653 [Pectobacterium atrosepticum ICMP 1526]